MINRAQSFKDIRAKLFAFALASIAAATSAFVPIKAGIAIPILVFLSVGAFSGLVIVWLRVNAAVKAAQEATSDCAFLAARLMRLEQHMRAPATSPALRSSMAEVTGTVGLFGGVVRELAKNVAAQNRDVADLKDTLKVPPKAAEEQIDEKSELKIPLEPRPIQASNPKPSAARETSLQPAAHKVSGEELGRMRLVTQAFEADRIELHLQPIVALPQRKIRFYEALARLRLVDGTLLGPTEFLPLLERLGRAPEFDRRVLNRVMAVARHLIARGSEAIVGVNLSSHSINDPGFLWSLTGLMDASPETLGKIVLELPQDTLHHLDSDRRAALATLRDRGVPMSLDHVADLRLDPRALGDLGIRFVKLPAELMIAAAEQEDDAHLGPELGVQDFASALRREGIRLIAERVEREEMVPALAKLGVPLAQGFVFAAPRAVKGEVLGGQAQPQPALLEGKQPLLRRAG
jgi:cyclic-di-GMP phosphodiesterase TipF (flagellum assembly factor)